MAALSIDLDRAARTPPGALEILFLVIAAFALREYGINDNKSRALISALEKAQRTPAEASLGQLFQRAKKLISSYIFPDKESVEWTLEMGSTTGLPSVTRKLNLAPRATEPATVNLPLGDLLAAANAFLASSGYSLWVLFGCLGVVFKDSPDLESV